MNKPLNTFLIVLMFSIIYHIFHVAIAGANEIENRFIAAGLTDLSKVDNSIRVNLVNSNPKKNFFREDYYHGLNKAYLREFVAKKLSTAQKILKEKKPSYSLQILDAARPRSVSNSMYDKMRGTKFEKYVANPATGSMHNYGIAVDITIVDKDDREIDMGLSPFNKNPMEIYWQYAKVKLGFKLSDKQKKNRKLLADVMQAAGFFPLSYEWWHFNGMEKEKVRRNYSIIE
jgi:zinc D-Ala-D-Ala dipeptidase